MTASEVVWFINHKYGEQAYLVETDEKILIFSRVSKWIIFKNDFARFHIYTLFHFNDAEREHYHIQNKSGNIDYLVFTAIVHDIENKNNFTSWQDFRKSWELYLLGREVESRAAAWDWITSPIDVKAT